MTVPAEPVLAEMMEIAGPGQQFVVGQKFLMAADAIFLDHLDTGVLDKDHLGFGPHGKDSGMPQPVFRLEEILSHKIIMGDMAFVAICHCPVRTVAPGGVLRRHDMAVHAGCRIIRQIGICPGGPENKQSKTYQDPDQDNYRELPSRWWQHAFYKS